MASVRTLYDKVIDRHTVLTLDGPAANETVLLYIDRAVLKFHQLHGYLFEAFPEKSGIFSHLE
jgi:hypothetical protein